MIDDFLAVHATSLKLRAQRTRLLATNIANADTPNYKARDLAFAEVLRDVGGAKTIRSRRLALSAGELDRTHSRHIKIRQPGMDAKVMYRQPDEASLDGNSVDKDLEQARFAENTIRYQASLEFIKSRVSGLLRALRSEQ
ncbi:MAG: flagellar basal body rod protein FlgB [Granulosicoccus sp.]